MLTARMRRPPLSVSAATAWDGCGPEGPVPPHAAAAVVPGTDAVVQEVVVLAGQPGLVRAYPHSLLEALATGRPVLVSDGNPMAEYVRETGCGHVVPSLEEPHLIDAIRQLRQSYEAYRARAREVGRRDFSLEALVTAHRNLYQTLAG